MREPARLLGTPQERGQGQHFPGTLQGLSAHHVPPAQDQQRHGGPQVGQAPNTGLPVSTTASAEQRPPRTHARGEATRDS